MFINCELRSCSQTWRILDKTDDVNIRHCQECDKDVFKAKNIKEVEKITSEGNCIAYFNDRKEILVGKPEYPESLPPEIPPKPKDK